MKRIREIWLKAREKMGPGQAEGGFAMVLVLIAITVLAILGALAMLLAASTLSGVVNMRPEDRAFQIADSACAIAHAKIVNQDIEGGYYRVPQGSEPPPSLLGGTYEITITGATPYWTVTAKGTYVSGGVTYQRKIQETVVFYGSQAFDVMKHYILFAGNDLTINCDEWINLWNPIKINGNIRANHNLTLNVRPGIYGVGEALTVNGDVEGVNRVDLIVNPQMWGSLTNPTKLTVSGTVKSGDAQKGVGGYVRAYAGGDLDLGRLIFKGADLQFGAVQSPQYLPEPDDWIFKFLFTDFIIRRIRPRTFTSMRACQPVYIPEANFEYFKLLAIDQGPSHYNLTGDLTISGNMSSYGSSSMTVFYAKGNITLNGFAWDVANTKAVFVCEGNFTSNSTLRFPNANSQFQVICKGNAYFNNSWDFSFGASSEDVFCWAGNDIYLHLGAFCGENIQFTAMHNIVVSSTSNLFSNASINYRAPDIDVTGFPIDVMVNEWKELPAE